MKAVVVLNPAASKRLIAEGLYHKQEVKKALKNGWVLINSGSTNSYFAGLVLNRKFNEEKYCAGKVTSNKLNVTPGDIRTAPVYLFKGKPKKKEYSELETKLSYGDVFIKGFNAFDTNGNVGIWAGGERSGTIGKSIGTLIQKGVKVILAGGMEKLVPDVPEAVKYCNDRIDYFQGLPARLFPLTGLEVFTEIQAIHELFLIKAIHLSSGGLGLNTGSVVIGVEGNKKEVNHLIKLVDKLQKQ